MKNQKENCFKSKFILLNSQEDSHEIIWSCSDSSDYEYSHNDINVKAVKRKRKLVKGKKKISNNVSNLDITFVDVTLEKNNEKNVEESQNHSNIDNVSNLSNFGCKSPILSSQRYVAPMKRRQSTVNCPSGHKEMEPVSPVLVLKYNTPKISPKIRKKLFNNNANTNQDTCRENRSLSPVLTCIENGLIKSSKHKAATIDNTNLNKDICQINTYREKHKYDSSLTKVQQTNKNNNNYKNEENPLIYEEKQIYKNNVNLDDTLTDKTSRVLLAEKVKLYFDSYFSSTTNSQHSISEYESKSSPDSNDDIEIINSLPQTKNSQCLKSDNKSSSDSLKFDKIPQTKKVKYKKDGLAYRLSVLIKKQNANTSLWYHERFLVANSNFVLPQEQFLAFRIQEVSFKYGCFLLRALNLNDDTCVIIINNLYAKSNIFKENSVLKLYKPYKFIESKRYQLIINVCKYECIMLKK
nr:putative uncharacterized protein DDB_G0290989 [Vanessa tameamea]